MNIRSQGCLPKKHRGTALAVRLKNYCPSCWPRSLDTVVCVSPGKQRQEMKAIYRRYETFCYVLLISRRVFIFGISYMHDG
jgi:hypothetical protein